MNDNDFDRYEQSDDGRGEPENPTTTGERQDHTSYLIGTEERFGSLSAQVTVPGPGHYVVQSPVETEATVKFGTESRFGPNKEIWECLKEQKSLPGPGTYSVTGEVPLTSNCIFTGEERFPQKEIGKSPGPSTYLIPDFPPTRGTIKFNSDDRFGDKDVWDFQVQAHAKDAPGPGAYGAPSEPSTCPAYKFDAAERFADMDRGPGPGHYEAVPQTSASGIPKFTAGDRFGGNQEVWDHQIHRRDLEVPGPGAYHAHYSFQGTHAAHKISTAERFPPEIFSAPGPAQYTLAELRPGTEPHKFSQGERFPTDSTTEAPGPGDYDTAVSSLGKQPESEKGTSEACLFPKDERFAPPLKVASEAHKFATEDRFGHHKEVWDYQIEGRSSGVTGPGDYDTAISSLGKQPESEKGTSEAFQFTRSLRFGGDVPDGTPGPEYEPASLGVGEVHTFAKEPRMLEGKEVWNFQRHGSRCALVPGVGTYEDAPCPTGVAHQFTGTKRFEDSAEANPGVGDYILPAPEPGMQSEFPKEQRFRCPEADIPGPGCIPPKSFPPIESSFTYLFRGPTLGDV
ncbi:hypothetical protein CYMTET_32075 [Cymbomonas tetramitiformis]|uniref:Uncharacterized protein n=1 Tax=Cymbomonas tetramitiformis TaxID=36881 RepID=A0AAE0KS99_9CHLO|nr:hypothetical protein CYMTET_32075 [Cymbomonas tetramitiformis]